MPSSDNRALLATCVAAAAKSAEVIRDGATRASGLAWVTKSQADFVSEVDHAAEHALAAVIHARHADATLIAEEFSPAVGALDGLVFIADPLDGTTNFLHGFPWYAVSIAAVVDGHLAAGAILNAATGELFTATAGGGARRAGQPIRVSPITDPPRALIGTGFPFKPENPHTARYLELLPRVMLQTAGLRRAGAAALDLADVACGRFEAFWEMTLAPWDIAAGILLIREAGGVVTDLEGEPCPLAHTSVVAGNPAMHEWLLAKLSS
ncbi:MAG TPA: inositol monophosphatase family protein [Gemmatimonadaceae bacterium]|nr:inositol monophosphatase family protein [Gemmatimonadaceae bacterium]